MSLYQHEMETPISKASATALVLMRRGDVISTAGDLSAEGVRTLCSALQRYWPVSAQQELNRTVGIALDDHYQYIFAKFLPHGKGLLGLVFPLQTPLIRIRQDMTDMMRSIIEGEEKFTNLDHPVEQSLQFEDQSCNTPAKADPQMMTGWQPEQDWQAAQDMIKPMTEETTHIPGKQGHSNSDSRKKYLTFGAPLKRTEEETPHANLSEQPNLEMTDVPWHFIDMDGGLLFSEPNHISRVADTTATQQSHDFTSLENNPAVGQDLMNSMHEDFQTGDELSSAGVLRSGLVAEREWERGKPGSETVTILAPKKAVEREEISDVTFYLLPRQDEQYLVGEIAQRLRSWMPAICEKYGWELSTLSVRPEYLKWTLSDFPESLILEMLYIIRAETSKRIFRNFSGILNGNQRMDYWAPGYLVDSTTEKYSCEF